MNVASDAEQTCAIVAMLLLNCWMIDLDAAARRLVWQGTGFERVFETVKECAAAGVGKTAGQR